MKSAAQRLGPTFRISGGQKFEDLANHRKARTLDPGVRPDD